MLPSCVALHCAGPSPSPVSPNACMTHALLRLFSGAGPPSRVSEIEPPSPPSPPCPVRRAKPPARPARCARYRSCSPMLARSCRRSTRSSPRRGWSRRLRAARGRLSLTPAPALARAAGNGTVPGLRTPGAVTATSRVLPAGGANHLHPHLHRLLSCHPHAHALLLRTAPLCHLAGALHCPSPHVWYLLPAHSHGAAAVTP